VRQSAAIAARYTPASAESATSPPADPAAPATPPAGAAATSVAPPASAPADPRENDPNYWRQRFNVTSGILAKERGERQSERGELNRRITDLQTQTASPKAVPDAAIDLSKFYTPEQIEQYGEEQCRVMAKTAMDAAHSTAQALIDAAVRPLKEEREREVADAKQAKKDAFYTKLGELHPSYAEDDVDPRWADEHTGWLAQEDENGVVRQQLLNIHLANLDATKVAKMFRQWKASITAAPSVPPVAPSGSGAAPVDGAPPANLGTGAAGAPSDADVKDFYKRAALGKVKDDERVAFDARMKLRNRAAA
jgi:hypothetical protein